MPNSGQPRTPAVSIIVPCFKYAHHLAACISSVVAQTYMDWECIIIDDGSPDDTAQVAQALIAQYPDKQIRLIRQANQGVGEARNRGVRESAGRYILPLDADDLLAPQLLEKTVAALESHPEAAVAFTDVKVFGVQNHVWRTGPFTVEALMQDNQLAYGSLYRREVWDAVGGYDARRRASYEDWEFWLDAAVRGFRGVHIAEPLLHYRTAPASRVTDLDAQRAKLIAMLVLNHPGLFGAERESAAARLLGTDAQPPAQRSFAPAVSVIVCTKNRPAELEAALRSVLAQTFQDFEIVVVNDGGPSVDALIESLDSGDKIQSLRLARGRGRAGARNWALRASRGRFIAYLDESARYQPEHLEKLVAALNDSQAAVAFSSGQAASAFRAERIARENCIALSSLMHERSCVEGPGGVGGFDESLGLFEDWDLCIRLAQRHSFVPIAAATVVPGPKTAEVTPLAAVTAQVVRAKAREAGRARAAAYQARMEPVTELLNAGKHSEALARMAQVVLADPTYAEAYNDLAVIDYQAGRFEEAQAAVARSLELEPGNATALETQAAVQSALAARRAEPERTPGDKYRDLAPQIEQMAAGGDADGALSALGAFLEEESESAEAQNDLAVVLHSVGRIAEAYVAAQRAHALQPESAGICCTLAAIQIARGELNDAAGTLTPVLERDPTNADVLTLALRIQQIAQRAPAPQRPAIAPRSVQPAPVVVHFEPPLERVRRAPAPKLPILALAFSRDRQMQLDATLRSLQLHWKEAGAAHLKVLTKATTDAHRALYRRLGEEHPRVELIAETDFRAQLLELLGRYQQVLFLVDDNIVVRPFSLAEASQAIEGDPRLLGVSLRLGRNTTRCYAMNRDQRPPVMVPAFGMNRYRWVGTDGDFGYPLEVSSSLYRAGEMKELLSRLAFRNPNELEAVMAARAPQFAVSQPDLLCFDRSVTFCNPVNMVQTTFVNNRAGSADELSPAALARRYAAGERVRVEAYRGFVPSGCHEEVPLEFERAPGEPDATASAASQQAPVQLQIA